MEREEELLKIIEQMNLELIDITNSKEYKIGSDFIKFKNMIKNFELIKLVQKIVNRKKLKKLNNSVKMKKDEPKNNIIDKKNKPKIAVYTCITGGYDNLLSPLLKFDNIDYYVFTNNDNLKSDIWKIKKIPNHIEKLNDNILINRYIKIHSYEMFDNNKYDYAIYIDGNIKVISDLTSLVYSVNKKTGLALHQHRERNCIFKEIYACKYTKKGNIKELKKQTEEYKNNGFPEEFGLYECNVIVTDLKNEINKKILKDWWDEFIKYSSLRDQISLPYVVWKKGFKFNDVGILGTNVYENVKIRLYNHRK